MIGQVENAAPLAEGNGVSSNEKNDKGMCSSFQHATPNRGKSAISIYGKDGHKRASNMLGYALTIGDFPAWEAASAIWAARLTVQERIALAFMALGSLDDDNAQMAAEAALFGITREAR